MDKQKITLEQIIAGALLMWPAVDNYILTCICDTLESFGLEIENPLNYKFSRLKEYIECHDDITSKGGPVFQIKRDLLEFDVEFARMLHKELETIAGPLLSEYLAPTSISDILNIGTFLTESNRKCLLENASILLTSELDEDCTVISDYGFQKIRSFNSADETYTYFQERISDLNYYNIFIIRNDESSLDLELRSYIDSLVKKGRAVIVTLSIYGDDEHAAFKATLNGSKIIRAETYADLFDAILLYMKTQGILFSLTPHTNFAYHNHTPNDYDKIDLTIALDEIQELAYAYIAAKKRKIIPNIEDLKIRKSKTGIRIETSYRGLPICAITLSNTCASEYNRIFALEVPNKKGFLSKPTLFEIRLSKSPNRLPEPTEEQRNLIIAVHKKMMVNVLPNIMNTKEGKKLSFVPINNK